MTCQAPGPSTTAAGACLGHHSADAPPTLFFFFFLLKVKSILSCFNISSALQGHNYLKYF